MAKAKAIINAQGVLEKPIDILEAALSKLRHKDLDLGNISPFEIEKAMEIVQNIQGEAESIFGQSRQAALRNKAACRRRSQARSDGRG
ncbi:MAG: hypothetical protein IPJ10_12585 [Flavobacteriales bacterium]|nr:hypothetical protein [Flavobacteriales bacterium]